MKITTKRKTTGYNAGKRFALTKGTKRAVRNLREMDEHYRQAGHCGLVDSLWTFPDNFGLGSDIVREMYGKSRIIRRDDAVEIMAKYGINLDNLDDEDYAIDFVDGALSVN